MEGGVLDSDGHVLGVVELDIENVEGSSLMFSNLQTNGRNVETLLFISPASSGFWGLLSGPLGHFLISLKVTLKSDLVWEVLAGSAELDSSLNLDLKVLLEKSLSENDKDVSVHSGRSVIISLKGQTPSWLFLGVAWLDNVFGKILESGWEELGSFIGGFT